MSLSTSSYCYNKSGKSYRTNFSKRDNWRHSQICASQKGRHICGWYKHVTKEITYVVNNFLLSGPLFSDRYFNSPWSAVSHLFLWGKSSPRCITRLIRWSLFLSTQFQRVKVTSRLVLRTDYSRKTARSGFSNKLLLHWNYLEVYQMGLFLKNGCNMLLSFLFSFLLIFFIKNIRHEYYSLLINDTL